MGDLKSPFKDAAYTPPSGYNGDWGGTKDGDTTFNGAKKGDRGQLPETTFVDVQSGPKPGAHAIGEPSLVANKKVKKDLIPL